MILQLSAARISLYKPLNLKDNFLSSPGLCKIVIKCKRFVLKQLDPGQYDRIVLFKLFFSSARLKVKQP